MSCCQQLGLAHHVGEAGLLDGDDELGAFVEGHRGRDGAEDVLAGGEAEQGVADVVRRGGGEEDRLDLRVLEELIERRVSLGATVGLLQGRAAIRAEVAHRLHDAIRMLMKLEGRAEAAADDADADFAGLGGERDLGGQREGAQRTEGEVPHEVSTGGHGVGVSLS